MRKEEILRNDHPTGRKIRAIPQIITEDRKNVVPASAIPLNRLFRKEEMDRWHIDGLILKKMALQLVRILAELSDAGITPGLIQTDTLLVNPDHSAYPIYLCQPEHFQLEEEEQDYEWYPEDERLFGQTRLFDRDQQLLADNRLVLKVMIGASKGNLKLPVRKNDQDHSYLFYRILPEEVRQHFENNEPYSYGELDQMLSASIQEEESFVRTGHPRSPDPSGHEDDSPPEIPADQGREVDILYLILRTEKDSPFSISRSMYLLMDEAEEDCRLTGKQLRQAFVYGDETVRVKEFQRYPEGFRCQFETGITECPPAEMMIIACELWAGELGEQQETGKDVENITAIVLDGRIPNDAMFGKAFSMMEEIAGRGVRFRICSSGEVQCEAVRRLNELAERERP